MNLEPTRIIVVSDTVRSYLCDNMQIKTEKIVVIENGIDFGRTTLARNKASTDIKKFYTIGRLIDAKGYEFLIESLADMSIKKLNWELIMIGDGELRSKLESKIIQLGMYDKIKLIGKKDYPFEIIEPGSFALMPSIREGLSISLLEFMSKGIPVLASDIKPFDLIEHKINGLKFVSKSKSSFVSQFQTLMDMDEIAYERISGNSIKTSKKYSINNCIMNYKKLCYE